MVSRAAAIEAIAGQRFEVVVIGGGITGAGVALDAASRGYSVAVLERGDYAIGTSSRSSKMVHGGLRYLQNLDLGRTSFTRRPSWSPRWARSAATAGSASASTCTT
jgi:glycerol-3-phosphate dehydrogenase